MSVELKVPRLGESIAEATIAKWMKEVGDTVAADEPIADLETDKITIALPAPAAGVLTEQRFPVGSTVKVGDVIGAIAEGATNGKPSKKAPVAVVAAVPAPVAVAPAPVAAVPSPIAVVPSAPISSTSSRPLTPHQRKAIREGASISASDSVGAPVNVSVSANAPDEVVAMTPLRRRIAERLVEAQHTAAILTTFNEVDMTNIMELRARYQESFTAQYGIKLGFMSFFAKAAVESLKRFPGLNAEIRGNDIVYKKHYDLGIAVGGGKGLVVPVVRGVDRMGFSEIEQTIANLAKKAKDNRLGIEEITGGTFSITNGGIYGSMLSTPLLNLPQTGILGMHNIIKRPIAVGENIEIRPMMYLALSYDHRVVDGREAVQFLVGIKERIENPERLMLAL